MKIPKHFNGKDNVKATGISILYRLSLILVLLIFGFSFHAYGICMGYHFDLIREAMLWEGYTDFSHPSIRLMQLSNAYVDLFQAVFKLGDSEAITYVLDDEFCEQAVDKVNPLHFDNLPNRDAIKDYWDKLIYAAHETIIKNKNDNDLTGMLLTMGIVLHIIQDFYAHSNWAELDLPKFSSYKNATFFEIDTATLEAAISFNNTSNMRRYGDEYPEDELFTHGHSQSDADLLQNYQEYSDYYYISGKNERPCHEMLKKDHAGNPYFDWAYMAAFKATVQWLKLLKTWMGDTYWQKIKNFSGEIPLKDSSISKSKLLNNTEMYTSKIVEYFLIGGSWKGPGSLKDPEYLCGLLLEDAGDADFFPVNSVSVSWGDDLNESVWGKWYKEVELISNELFEGEYEDTAGLNNLRTSNNSMYNSAYTSLKSAVNIEKWVRVRIPHIDGGDCGDVTAEDYFALIVIDGLQYREAHILGNNDPWPVWTVLKPIKSNKTINIAIKIKDDDGEPDDDDLCSTFPAISFNTSNYNISGNYYDANRIPWGWRIRNSSTYTDTIEVGIVSDARVEFIIKVPPAMPNNTYPINNDDPVYASSGSFLCKLDKGEHDDFALASIELDNGSTGYLPLTETYAVHPGTFWQDDMLYTLMFYKDTGGDTLIIDSAYARAGKNTCKLGFGPHSLQDSVIIDSGYISNLSLLSPADSEKDINRVSIISTTGNKTDNKIELSFLDTNQNEIWKGKLDDVIKNNFESDNTDFFYFQPGLTGKKIKDIAYLKLKKDGTNNWEGSMKIWVNDKILHTVPLTTLSSQNNTYLSVMSYPDYLTVAPLSITSQGLVIKNGKQVHMYKITTQASIKNWKNPSFSFHVTPDPGDLIDYQYAAPLKKTDKFSSSSCTIFLPVGKTISNLVYDYILSVRVFDAATEMEQKQEIPFSIPKPSISIQQTGFIGGNTVFPAENDNPNKHLQYSATYKIEVKNFVTTLPPDFFYEWQSGTEKKTDQNYTRTYTISLPTADNQFIYTYEPSIYVKDKYGIQDVPKQTYYISLPVLKGSLELKYDEIEKTITAEDFPILTQYGKALPDTIVGTTYKKAVINAAVWMEKWNKVYSTKVLNPSYTWKVWNSKQDNYPFKHPFILKGNLNTGGILTPSEVEMESIEIKNTIILDLSSLAEEASLFVECTVTDEVGQYVFLETIVNKSKGIAYNHQYIMQLVSYAMMKEHPELYQGIEVTENILYWDGPIPEPNPERVKDEEPKTRDVFDNWNYLRLKRIEIQRTRDKNIKRKLEEDFSGMILEFLRTMKIKQRT